MNTLSKKVTDSIFEQMLGLPPRTLTQLSKITGKPKSTLGVFMKRCNLVHFQELRDHKDKLKNYYSLVI